MQHYSGFKFRAARALYVSLLFFCSPVEAARGSPHRHTPKQGNAVSRGSLRRSKIGEDAKTPLFAKERPFTTLLQNIGFRTSILGLGSRRVAVMATQSPKEEGDAGESENDNASGMVDGELKSKPRKDNDDSADIAYTSAEMLPTYMVIVPIVIIVFAVFECFHKRFADVDFAEKLDLSKQRQLLSCSTLFQGIWPICRIYCCCPDDRYGPCHGKGLAFACLVLGAFRLFLQFIFTLWMKEFWDCMEKKQFEKFQPLLLIYIVMIGCWVLVWTYLFYLASMLEIEWRQHLTRYLQERWMQAKAFYQLQLDGERGVDNPDQRIQEDAGLFVANSIWIGGGFFMSTSSLLVYLPLLVWLSPKYAFGLVYLPGWLALVALIYSLGGSIISHVIGRQLILIGFAKQRFEADFRHSLVQVRDHSESVALYNSEVCEEGRLANRFVYCKRIWWEQMLYVKLLGFFQSFYQVTGYLFPLFVLTPNYFAGQITLGSMMQILMAFNMVKWSFDWFINNYLPLMEYRATIDRLTIFLGKIESKVESATMVKKLQQPPPGTDASVAVVTKDLYVDLPPEVLPDEQIEAGRNIWRNASLTIQRGSFVLLTAPEGTGKSCFFRALAGLWPHSKGETWFQGDTLFLPQKSYIPQGPLKLAVAYPMVEDTYTDDEVKAALVAVGLPKVAARDLQESANWSLVLSGGEQQRLGLARVLLRKPSCLFLDEATSAIGQAGTLEIFKLLRSGALPQHTCVVTISHKIDLLKPLHDKTYAYNDGNWEER
eukprot:gnl/MRDRNA2_/MRDRNA2_104420_c0_seq1.p1 gnl/MRDRNA2_/MRDRNA2_104420_c0~~gnl/MRDRNA2_/MRDRNA2_104420_c0_seq1.p1  ORF type:complete len:769 (-),score=108.08 gnl/MRDRNA2_/MRDRNA2_104420_c0_seq1:11-2317(-)